MEVKTKKQVRFDAVAQTAGQPIQVTLWTKSEDDREFMRAVKDRRVVTVIQHNVGTKKDYGIVGFYPQDRATYLLFPKPLGLADETKIVGIKYEQLATAEPKGAIYTPPKVKLTKPPTEKKAKPEAHTELEPPAPKKGEAKPEPPAPEPPKLFKFQSTVELKATQTTMIEVEATSAKTATKLLKAAAEELTIDTAQAKVTRKVGKAQRKVSSPV